MSVAVALNNTIFPDPVDCTQQQICVDGTLTLTGNYGGAATHGDTMSFAGLDAIKSNQVPNLVEIFEAPAAGNAPTGFLFAFGYGTTQANGVLIVMQDGAAAGPEAELTQGAAYPAALLAATANLRFRAWFPRSI
jgi:hypothetical protein